MAHDSQELLVMLIKLLDSEYHDFFIHIDKKSDSINENVIKNTANKSSVTFIKRRDINWGGYSQVATEQALLFEAMKHNYSYYHLLSGHDLPLKPAEQIYHFFEESRKNYVNFREKTTGIESRIKWYHFFQEKRGNSDNAWNKIEKINLKIQKILGIDRLASIGNYDIAFGSQWFSITHELVCYIYEKKNEIKRIFRYGMCVDELFMQTMIANSRRNWNLAFPPDNYSYYTCMRYVDWIRGNPYTFQRADYQELMKSNCMFARKFDLKEDHEICDMIFHTLLADYT